jgi:uncharacterized protein YerC
MRGERTIRKPFPTLRGIDKLDDVQRKRLLTMLKSDAPYNVIERRFSLSRATIAKFGRANGISRDKQTASRQWW